MSESEIVERESVKILFVCSMNQWRSPTAEKVYADKPLVTTRSCGTSSRDRKTVNSQDLNWADVVMVMEQKHKQRIVVTFPGDIRFKKLYVLDIPDDYKFMDPELVEEIEAAVEPILKEYCG